MLQKVAAKVDFVAANLCFMACEVRWLLPEKYFDFAASSAAVFLGTNNSYVLKREKSYKSNLLRYRPRFY